MGKTEPVKARSDSGRTDGDRFAPVRLFQFPRPDRVAIPNFSPFCCKLETWLRIAGIDYEVVETPNPGKGPKGKLPFIEEGGLRIADSSAAIEFLKKARGIDPDRHLTDAQRALGLLVQRTLEEHYAFVILYTHFIRPDGWRVTRSTFDYLPTVVRPLVRLLVRRHMRKILWMQGLSRHPDAHIMELAIADWRAIAAHFSKGPFFHGDRPSSLDAVLYGALATTVLSGIDSPVAAFLRSQPRVLAYAGAMRARYFPELDMAAAGAAHRIAALEARVISPAGDTGSKGA